MDYDKSFLGRKLNIHPMLIIRIFNVNYMLTNYEPFA